MNIEINGSMGEGGGQIIRSSLTLSLLTGKSVRIQNIRAGRKKPGLLRQHLTAAQAAAEISGGELEGARLGAGELSFTPQVVQAGNYRFSIGSAGSTMLVLQTVLLPLCLADGPSEVILEGGTHNPWSPTFDFLDRCFLPLLERMGPKVRAHLERPGFYPAGGGRVRIQIEPVSELQRLDLLERGEITDRRAVAAIANLDAGIARRQLKAVKRSLSWHPDSLEVQTIDNAKGPGNVLRLEIQSQHVTAVFTGFGRMQASAQQIASEACDEAKQYLAAGVPVGKHLADQLILPMVVAGGGSFRTLPPSRHTQTQLDLVREFLGQEIRAEKLDGGQWQISI